MWWPRLMTGGMFGFFGLLMAASAVSAARLGDDPDAIQVGPAGLWLPQMGRLAWMDITEIRLETIRGVGSGDAPITKPFRRLGVVPADPSRRPDPATRVAWGMTMGFLALLRRMVPESRFGGEDPAPFGLSESEVDAPWEDVVAAVSRFAPVVDAAEARARRRAARWAAPASPGATPPITEGRIHELDAAFSHEPAVPSPAGASILPSATDGTSGPQPRATFSVPLPGISDLAVSAVTRVVPLAIFLGFIGPMGSRVAGPLGVIYLVIFGTFAAGFLLPGLVRLGRGLRAYRRARSRPESLAVGPDGIWLPEMGRVAWDRIGRIATERAGWAKSSAGPPVERWRLVVTPTDGPGAGGRFDVASDELGARFDDVLDLVRFYHPVIEAD